jgi:threonine synthase
MKSTAAFHTHCTACRRIFDDSFTPLCPSCSAMTDVTYKLDQVRLHDSVNPYERFFDLLPIRNADLLPRDARFTPTVHAVRLGEEIGLPWLYLKDETGLPTRTTKDRMAAVALPYLYESGVRRFATSSTGNSSSAYAHALTALPEMTLYLFTAEAFRPRLTLTGNSSVIDVVLRDATFVDAFAAAGEFAEQAEVVSERGFFNPGRREGLKVAWMEAAEQVPQRIGWYVQAVSSAMGVYGVFKGACELYRLGAAGAPPSVLCVQEDTCAPMVAAWEDGSGRIRPEHVVSNPRGIAAAIQRGDPTRAYPHVARIVRESKGGFIAVSETEIREAHAALKELEGIHVCFAAAAAVAGLIRWRRLGRAPVGETYLINLTGGEREGTPVSSSSRWLDRSSDGWEFGDLGEMSVLR